MAYTVVSLPGDGIGIEVLAEGMRVMHAVAAELDLAFDVEEVQCGGRFYLQHEHALCVFRQVKLLYVAPAQRGDRQAEEASPGATAWRGCVRAGVSRRPVVLQEFDLELLLMTPAENHYLHLRPGRGAGKEQRQVVLVTYIDATKAQDEILDLHAAQFRRL